MKITACIVGVICCLFMVNCLMFSLAKPIAMYRYAIEYHEKDAKEENKWVQNLRHFQFIQNLTNFISAMLFLYIANLFGAYNQYNRHFQLIEKRFSSYLSKRDTESKESWAQKKMQLSIELL